MFKFVEADVGSIGQKRKQWPRACETCRKRKKRCNHTDAAESQEVPLHQLVNEQHHESDRYNCQERSPLAQFTVAVSPPSNSNANDGNASTTGTTQLHVEPSVGSRTLEYEALGSRFIGDLNPEAIFQAATSPDTTRGASLEDSIGVWLSKRLGNGAHGSGSGIIDPQSPSSLFYGSASLVQKVLLPVLVEETLSTLPLPTKVDALSKIYFERIQPILPVIDEKKFSELHLLDPGRILLQQGICLAASKNYIAREYLVLAGSDSLLTCREFGNRLFAAMRLSTELGLVTDNIVLIQALILMSHFADGPDSGELSSQLCGRAVHHAQTVGLHLRWRRQNLEDQYGITLLCCIWVLDRMNAAFLGRPVLIHERDIGASFEQCFEQQGPYFRLLLHVVLLLDKTIELYRPLSTNETRMDVDFPSFEELVARCPGSQIVTPLLATVETLYHGVAILSYRSRSYDELQRSSTSYLRQSVSSLHVSSITSRECRNPDQLVIFPFVPYTISLALSISYREMRHSKIPLHRVRARAQFQFNCDALNGLGEAFWSAANIAEMGKAILKEMDRVFVVASEQRKTRWNSVQGDINIENPSRSTPQFNMSENRNTTNALPVSQPHDGQVQMPEYNPSLYDPVLDFDLFGMFDPAFDLEGIDARLEGNLDLSFPNHLSL